MERLTERNDYIGFMETYLNIDCENCQFKSTGECEEFKDECRAVAEFKNFVKAMYSKLKEYEDFEEQTELIKSPETENGLISKKKVLELIKPRLNSSKEGTSEYQKLYSILISIEQLPAV